MNLHHFLFVIASSSYLLSVLRFNRSPFHTFSFKKCWGFSAPTRPSPSPWRVMVSSRWSVSQSKTTSWTLEPCWWESTGRILSRYTPPLTWATSSGSVSQNPPVIPFTNTHPTTQHNHQAHLPFDPATKPIVHSIQPPSPSSIRSSHQAHLPFDPATKPIFHSIQPPSPSSIRSSHQAHLPFDPATKPIFHSIQPPSPPSIRSSHQAHLPFDPATKPIFHSIQPPCPSSIRSSHKAHLPFDPATKPTFHSIQPPSPSSIRSSHQAHLPFDPATKPIFHSIQPPSPSSIRSSHQAHLPFDPATKPIVPTTCHSLHPPTHARPSIHLHPSIQLYPVYADHLICNVTPTSLLVTRGHSPHCPCRQINNMSPLAVQYGIKQDSVSLLRHAKAQGMPDFIKRNDSNNKPHLVGEFRWCRVSHPYVYSWRFTRILKKMRLIPSMIYFNWITQSWCVQYQSNNASRSQN